MSELAFRCSRKIYMIRAKFKC